MVAHQKPRPVTTDASTRGDGRSLVAEIELRAHGFTLDVDFTVRAGHTAVMVGPNGAGKSTTLAAIAGLVRPRRAYIAAPQRVFVDTERDIDLAPEQRRVGVMFADGLLFEHMTVSRNVAFGMSGRGALRNQRLTGALDAFDLTALRDRRPSQLSSGQAQRVALARALSSDPDVVLLDEPLARIDHAARPAMRRMLRSAFERTGAPRLVITHDATEAFLLADQMLIIEDGRITQRGTPEEVRRHPRTTYAAQLAGTNLFRGTAANGRTRLSDYPVEITSSDTTTSGAVLLTVHPRAATLHASEPSGSPRNVCAGVVEVVEPLGEVTRVVLAQPLPLTVDITPGAARELGLTPGSHVWVAIKATEVELRPAEREPDAHGG